MSASQIRENVNRVLPGQNETPQYLLLSEILDKRVQTQSGITIGKLKDLVFKDDPHYASEDSTTQNQFPSIRSGRMDTTVSDPPPTLILSPIL